LSSYLTLLQAKPFPSESTLGLATVAARHLSTSVNRLREADNGTVGHGYVWVKVTGVAGEWVGLGVHWMQ
jgi:hypothetical protein